MKTFAGSCVTSLGMISLSVLLFTGCASNGTARATPPVPESAPGQADRHDVNARYVAAVERLARLRGAQVVWVNKPLKRVSGTVANAD